MADKNGLWQGISGAVGGLLDGLGIINSNKAQQKQNEFNAQEAAKQRAWQEKMFDKSYQLNSASSVASQYRAAGLNSLMSNVQAGQGQTFSGTPASASGQSQAVPYGDMITRGLNAYAQGVQTSQVANQSEKISEEAQGQHIHNSLDKIDLLHKEASVFYQLSKMRSEAKSAEEKAQIDEIEKKLRAHTWEFQVDEQAAKTDAAIARAGMDQYSSKQIQNRVNLELDSLRKDNEYKDIVNKHQASVMEATAQNLVASAKKANADASLTPYVRNQLVADTLLKELSQYDGRLKNAAAIMCASLLDWLGIELPEDVYNTLNIKRPKKKVETKAQKKKKRIRNLSTSGGAAPPIVFGAR